MIPIARLSLLLTIALVMAGCGESFKGKPELPANAKENIGQPTVLGGGSISKMAPNVVDVKKGKTSGTGSD